MFLSITTFIFLLFLIFFLVNQGAKKILFGRKTKKPFHSLFNPKIARQLHFYLIMGYILIGDPDLIKAIPPKLG